MHFTLASGSRATSYDDTMPEIDPVRVFVSYKKDDVAGDRKGRAFVDELATLVRERSPLLIDLWYDRELRTGEQWSAEIDQRLNNADFYVLVYTAAFFEEKGFIAQTELPTVLRRLPGVPVIPVVRTSINIQVDIPVQFAALRAVQASGEGRPLDEMLGEERTAAFERLADDIILTASRQIANRLSTAARPAVMKLISDVTRVHDEQLRGIGTQPEDQLKTPVKLVLEALAPNVSPRDLTVNTEDARPNEGLDGVRLDLSVIDAKSGYRVGHIELKAPHKGANPSLATGMQGWTAHDKNQWAKLKGLPNLIYSNGYEWTLFRTGVRVGSPVRLDDFAKGHVPDAGVRAFTELIAQFLSWSPTPPRTARGLAKRLAPLARVLRDAVQAELERANGADDDSLARMHRTWQETLMPDATNEDFADGVAQTFTYGLLLARLEDKIELPLDPEKVARSLRTHGHKLLGSVLDLLAEDSVRARIDEPIGLVESAIAAVDPEKLSSKKDTWLYFYEDFLAEYDAKRRKDAGVYFTPVEVVQTQVRLVDHVLRTRFGKAKGIGDQNVSVLDPAVGTGTYLLAVAEHVLAEADQLQLPKSEVQSQLRRRLYGFEILIGAYSVAHLRLTQLLQNEASASGHIGVNVYFSDTLAAPTPEHGKMDAPALFWGDVQKNIVEEQRRSSVVKSDQTTIQVILGNPPYNRTKRSDDASSRNIVTHGADGVAPLIDSFRNPVVKAGKGGALKHNLDDLYVHFLRWAIWKACEQNPDTPGVVSFITNSSYLRSVPFLGVREHMRRQFDEIWIIDLGGGNRGARPEPNVFAIQTPVSIVVAFQRPTSDSGAPISPKQRLKSPARVWYQRIRGDRAEKLNDLTALAGLRRDDDAWAEVRSAPGDWGARFVPEGVSQFWSWPELDALFPWQHSGSQYTRSWPIAPSAQVLRTRWNELFATGTADPIKFKESRDRKVVPGEGRIPKPAVGLTSGETLPALDALDAPLSFVAPVRYGFRTFDRMWCLPDPRVGDFLRTPVWRSYGNQQTFLTTLTQSTLGSGPAITATALVPDLHHFRGSYGGGDTYPLWRDSSATQPNVTRALLPLLEKTYCIPVLAEDLYSYVFGILGTSGYTARFSEDLTESTARVPITKDPGVFAEVAAFGRTLLVQATYGERFGSQNEFGQRVASVEVGSARVRTPIGQGEYPNSVRYDAERAVLHVGDGEFENVRPEVWAYQVSKLQVVNSWVGYRLRDRRGKKTSPLDDMGPETWEFDEELLELLWIVEFFVDAEPKADALLERILLGDVFAIAELPTPELSETLPPNPQQGDALFEDE